MPNVDVEFEGGQIPDFDVETGNVDIGTTDRVFAVPDVDVTVEESTVELPY